MIKPELKTWEKVMLQIAEATKHVDIYFGDETGNWIDVDGNSSYVLGFERGDVLKGSQKNDVIVGNAGDDFLKGNNGDDFLRGDKGDDLMVGGNGKDTFTSFLGNDKLLGGNGKDTFIFKGNEKNLENGDDRGVIVDFHNDEIIIRGGASVRNNLEFEDTEHGVLISNGDNKIALVYEFHDVAEVEDATTVAFVDINQIAYDTLA